MTAHAPSSQAHPISARIAQLPHLPMPDLWRLWDEHFDDRPGHHHRGWLESRLAYRMQERAFGGLKPSLRRRLETIGESGILPAQLRQQAQRLMPGTVLARTYDDREHRVLVRGPSDFDYLGQRFKSLSAIARHITGTHWSGPLFFGLREPGTKKDPA